ncbi:MAG: aromatic ring-hydroxylating dioxygenase subunit alpha [Acidobacteria bacterium]|nr:aromatic ring-hydroxylating dioxygenase subunit alpha [Acidobacteriota bacterium]
MDFKDFWYIAAESKDLRSDCLWPVQILDEWLVLFRDETGRPVALEDRCLHRCAQLSTGKVHAGKLQCGYHGWIYDGMGQVVSVPSEGPESKVRKNRCARSFPVCEQDGYLYVRLSQTCEHQFSPFAIPFYGTPGWAAIRLKNRFHNTVTNCVENFVDIPHTTFVHPRIFRDAKAERFTAQITRKNGSVVVAYHNERSNFGWFSKFLNPTAREIQHTDSFHLPNITSVDYIFSQKRRFIITSQSIPVSDDETLVYTDLTYNYGIWNLPARPLIRWLAQRIIDQDIAILNNQMQTIRQFGAEFSNTEADTIHVLIESIRNELAAGRDPRLLPEKKVEIEFWV